MKETFTFDDVALVPQFNNIPSRVDPVLDSWMTKNKKISIPIVCANMDTTISEELADILIAMGSIPVFHRFSSMEIQRKWVEKYKEKTFISCGLTKLEETRSLLDMGACGVCIDVAHGHSDKMFRFIGEIKRSHSHVEVIAGNVCTPMAYHDLVNAGADAVKVGIGSGAACTTRMVTGFGVPQFTAIYECGAIAEKLRIPLIADGGIRSSRDLVLALAAGASSVMIGKLFAVTMESSAVKRQVEDPLKYPCGQKMEARYRGQASESFQTDFYGSLKEKTVAEGVDFWAKVSGSAHQLLASLLGGLRSGLTYGGARNIKELQRKAEFVKVASSSSYLLESRPRML
jgi:IMP dehydrogenase